MAEHCPAEHSVVFRNGCFEVSENADGDLCIDRFGSPDAAIFISGLENTPLREGTIKIDHPRLKGTIMRQVRSID